MKNFKLHNPGTLKDKVKSFIIGIISLFILLVLLQVPRLIREHIASQKEEPQQFLQENSSIEFHKEVYIEYLGTRYLSNKVFESFNISNSSFVKEAWFDADKDYLILKLQDKYYHFCRFNEGVWEEFKRADSYGEYFNLNIKNMYNC